MPRSAPRFDRTVLEIARGIGVTEHPRKRNTGKTVEQLAKALAHRTEHLEQSYLIQRLSALEGRYPELELLYAVPNGGWRSKAQGGKLKAEGVKPSVPDLVLPAPRSLFHGLYVEMKQIGKYGSAEQRKFQQRLFEQGYAVVECQGEEPAYTIIMGYLAMPRWEADEFGTRARSLRLLAGSLRGVTIPTGGPQR